MRNCRTVFLADDDKEDREIFIEAINSIDPSIQLFTATNGIIALKSLQGDLLKKPDVIFLDVNMPLLNGKQLLAELKRIESLKDIPVIMYSTFFGKNEQDEMIRMGAVQCLVKPTKFNLLQSSLQNILVQQW